MTEQNKWDKLVIKVILSNKTFEIQTVKDYECIKTLVFDQSKYPTIVSLINKKDWESLLLTEDNEKNDFGVYLNIIRFSSQDGKKYVATIYDSDELWQDPEIIEIILLS